MLYSYDECVFKAGSDYLLKKEVEAKKIYKIEKGIYSDIKAPSELSLILFKYPKGIFHLESAYYYQGLTDTIPDQYILCTDRDAAKIKDRRVKQIFCSKKLLDIGKGIMDYQNVKISIYNRERLLIDLVRNRDKMPYDYYKEIIRNYRNLVHELDIEQLQEYIVKFPKKKFINETIEKEVF